MAVETIEEHLVKWINDNSKGNIPFLAQQILSDVEGLFGHLFGEPRAANIICGHASRGGALMLTWKLPKKQRPTKKEVLETIVKRVHDGTLLNDDWLEIAGYHRNKKNVVINKVNGLIFGVTDAEHWLCKSWVLIRKTFNHYRNSLYPVPLQPFYHPIRYRGDNVPDSITCDRVMDKIMKEATDTFERCAIKKNKNIKTLLIIPDIIVM